ncbi:hypothetical protein [Kushneria aurantia]|uniref:DUF4136 domain-containing protein n=1 Tax=Kushneria aurantia TaxID=504092 RepID=A0ABV6G7N1_9GAMM|nr:hypothetical protein [Kushneria aurantia]
MIETSAAGRPPLAGPARALLAALAALTLAGCVASPSSSPLALEPGTSWRLCTLTPEGSRIEQIEAISAALEADGYEVVNTDVALGLVSAQRTRLRPGLGAVETPFGGPMWRLGFGRGIRYGGVGYGLQDPWWGFRDDPRSVERVSASAAGEGYNVVKSITTLSADGYVIDARDATNDAFCRQLSQAVDNPLTDSEVR